MRSGAEPVARAITCCLLVAALGAGGCTRDAYRPAPVDAAGNADRLLARSLSDPGLGRYLAMHGIETERWPPAVWTLEALTAAAIYFDDGIAVARARRREAAAAETTAAQGGEPALTPALAWDSQPDSAGDPPFTFGLAAAIPLDRGSRRAARQAMASTETAARTLDTMRRGWTRRAILRDAAIACHAAERRLAGVVAQREVLEAIAALQERRRALGEVGVGSVARARRDVEETAREEARANGARRTCRGQLAAALGVPVGAIADIRLDARELERAESSLVPARAARRAALTHRLDIRAALSRHAAAEARLALEIARQQPDFTLEPGLFWDQGGLVWSLGSQIGLRLLYDNSGPIGEAAAARDTAARAVTARQADVLAALATADAALAAAQLHRDAARAAVRRAGELRAIAETRLAGGEAGRLAVLEAELGAAAAASAETEAGLAVLTAVAAYEDIVEQAVVGRPGVDFARLALVEPGR